MESLAKQWLPNGSREEGHSFWKTVIMTPPVLHLEHTKHLLPLDNDAKTALILAFPELPVQCGDPSPGNMT